VIAFKSDVWIECPLEEVFAYVSEPLNLPHWNSAVESVRRTEDTTYVMERELATGRALNRLDVVASDPPREFTIRATAGPTPFLYRYRFSSENGHTVVTLDAEVELPGPAALFRRAVKRGVDDNLAVLKRILEMDGSAAQARWLSRRT
jgi:ligand-binding SRPBCC domain-containing protein